MVHIGSIPGALIAFILCERIGLLWSMRQLCLLWLAGVIVVITSPGNLGQLYAGRFIMGLGIGQAGVVAPTYLAEIAPAHARGMLVSTFAMSEYVGIMVGVRISWHPLLLPALTLVVFLCLGCFVAYIEHQRQPVDRPSKHTNCCGGDFVLVVLPVRGKSPVSGKGWRMG
jgi:MFS family permease